MNEEKLKLAQDIFQAACRRYHWIHLKWEALDQVCKEYYLLRAQIELNELLRSNHEDRYNRNSR